MNEVHSQVPLAELVQHLSVVEPLNIKDQIVTGIAYDSRQVQPGNLFVALMGGNVDGHHYIPDAICRGASAVVGSQALDGLAVPYIRVRENRAALAKVSAAFYDFPARKMTVIGVTGTDGKTTTSNLLFHILQAAGLKTGMISTVNAVIGSQIMDTGFHVTTPEAPAIQAYLAQMVQEGLDFVILEVTSHGLDQQRVGGCDFDIGVVTNITHEHLDYHDTYDAYRAAKARLFTSLSETPGKPFHPPRAAVLNLDDRSYPYLEQVTRVRKISYGFSSDADIQAVSSEYRIDGMKFIAQGKGQENKYFSCAIETHLTGSYNVSNCLAAIAVAAGVMNLPLEAVQKGIADLPIVPGRWEQIDLNREFPGAQEFFTIVDFAHTPNALMRTLEAARQMTTGRVIAVFGSAGLRDRAKRQMMAEISAQLADISIFTAEDPRTENVDSILDEMANGARSQGGIEEKTFWRVPDRREAIRFALRLARRGDLVIACGKGHEQSMCFGEVEYPWDDRLAMRAALAERLGVSGPEMPFLPT